MKNVIFLLTLIGVGSLQSQTYDLSAGLRLGTDWGATVQLRMPYVHKNFVVEGILQSSLQREEGLVTILGKQHKPILSRRLNLFYGAGPHFGWSDEETEMGESIAGAKGISGVIGAEITLGGVNLSYDFKPAVNLAGGSKTIYTQSAISVRYVLAKRGDIYDKKKERQRNREKRKRKREREREKRGKGRFEFWKKGNG